MLSSRTPAPTSSLKTIHQLAHTTQGLQFLGSVGSPSVIHLPERWVSKPPARLFSSGQTCAMTLSHEYCVHDGIQLKYKYRYVISYQSLIQNNTYNAQNIDILDTQLQYIHIYIHTHTHANIDANMDAYMHSQSCVPIWSSNQGRLLRIQIRYVGLEMLGKHVNAPRVARKVKHQL